MLIRELERISNAPARRLLIVDDDEVSRYIVRTAISDQEFVVTEAESGQEGLRRAAEELPDVIVLDLMMPDLSGFEVLDRLKADSQTAGIPVIIRTSKVLDSRDRDLLSAATAIVSKESKSQEASHANLADAFRIAGFPLTTKSGKEVHHV